MKMIIQTGFKLSLDEIETIMNWYESVKTEAPQWIDEEDTLLYEKLKTYRDKEIPTWK